MAFDSSYNRDRILQQAQRRSKLAQIALHHVIESLSLTEEQRAVLRTAAAEWALSEGELARAVLLAKRR
jgi:hypothetical protein